MVSCGWRWWQGQGETGHWEFEKLGGQAEVHGQACLPPSPRPGFQSKTLAELEDIFAETAEAQELASGIGDAAEARQWLRTKLQAVGEKAGFPGVLGEALGVRPRPPVAPQLPRRAARLGLLRIIIQGPRFSDTSCSAILRAWFPSAGFGFGYRLARGWWREEEKGGLIEGTGLHLKTTQKLHIPLWAPFVTWLALPQRLWGRFVTEEGTPGELVPSFSCLNRRLRARDLATFPRLTEGCGFYPVGLRKVP